MSLSQVLKNVLLGAVFSVSLTQVANSAPAIVSDVNQTNVLTDINATHNDQLKVLEELREQVTAVKDAIGPGSGGYGYYSGAPGLASPTSSYGSKSDIIESDNDVDKLAEQIKSAFSKNDKEDETTKEKLERIKKKNEYVADLVVHGLSVAINIREGVSQTEDVIAQMSELSEESSGTVIQDISVNNRIMVELLKYVAQVGVATAVNAELVASDYLNKDDSL